MVKDGVAVRVWVEPAKTSIAYTGEAAPERAAA
jgi:hypothetical protein